MTVSPIKPQTIEPPLVVVYGTETRSLVRLGSPEEACKAIRQVAEGCLAIGDYDVSDFRYSSDIKCWTPMDGAAYPMHKNGEHGQAYLAMIAALETELGVTIALVNRYLAMPDGIKGCWLEVRATRITALPQAPSVLDDQVLAKAA